MRSSTPTSPFDHEYEAEADLTEEFWGGSGSWQSHDDRTPRRLPKVDDTGSLRAIRDGVAAFRPQRVELRDPSGEVRRTRSHGGTTPVEPTIADQRAQSSIGDLASGRYDDVVGHHERERTGDIALTPVSPITERLGLGGVDPLIIRLCILLLVGVLLIPIALALRPSSDAPDTVQIDAPVDPAATGAASASAEPIANAAPAVVPESGEAPAPVAAPAAAPAPSAAAAPVAASTQTETSADSGEQAATAPAAAAVSEAPSDASVGDVPESADAGIDQPAAVEAEAERIVPECPQTYTAGAGDSWYRMADAAGITPSALMSENRATLDSVILPGDEICLPAGATVPQPPPAPAPEPAPVTTTPATTATTAAPSTTVAATVPSGSPGRNASVDEIKILIRNVFPESEWETAFTIVQRESRFTPTAYNGWCCYGLFQIYWTVHDSWLGQVGVHSSNDLLDPLLNVRAAHVLWQRAGNSWSPWSTYDG